MKYSFSKLLLSFAQIIATRRVCAFISKLKSRRRLAMVLLSIVVAAILLAFAASPSKTATSGTSVLSVRPNKDGAKAHGKDLLPLVPPGPVVAATLADDIPLANKKNPGDTITYKAVITNTGTDATGVVYNDTLDPNTTQTGSVTISPLAINDGTYQSIGNMTLTSASLGIDCAANALRSVTCNDTANGASLVGFGDTQVHANNVVADGTNTSTTLNGGTVKLNTDGTFVYDPAVGFEGSDSFWYTLSNTSVTPNLTDNAQVTINVGGANGMVWFINSGATACTTLPANCGRQAIAAFNTLNTGVGNNPAAGDTIFLFEGAYTGPVTLLGTQKFIGQDATVSVPTLGGPSLPTAGNAYPATNPSGTTVSITGATTITLGSGNTLAGFTVGGSTTAITGGAVGTLKEREVIINSTGQGLIITTSGTAATDATFTGFTSVTTTGGTNGISLTGVGGTLVLGSGALSGASGATFNLSGGTATITYSGNIGQSNAAAAVNISGSNTGTLTLSGNITTSGSNTGLVFAASNGSYTFSGTNSLGGVNAVTIGTSTGTFSFGVGTSVSNTTGIAVQINGTQPVVLFAGSISQTANAQKSIVITGVTGGSTAGVASPNSIKFSGNINHTTAQTAIDINNNSGGSFGFTSGTLSLSTTTATAVSLSTNTGSSISFPAALSITTSSGIGINGTTGGTFTLNGSINAVSGQALILNNVALNAGTMSSVTSGGGTNGISLTSVTGGTLAISGGSLASNSGSAFKVSGGAATVSYAGSITQNTASQKAVDVASITGGTITLSGAIGSNGGTGVQIEGTGGTVNISGAMTLNNATSVFKACSGTCASPSGTGLHITATGANNTVGATNAATATGVTISGAQIDAGGVTFKSVSVNGGGTATEGILVTNIGDAGFFTIAGNGSAATGGTIQNIQNRGASFIGVKNINLNWMTFTSANTTDGAVSNGTVGGNENTDENGAIHLVNATNVAISNVTITTTAQHGINGNTVTNLDLTNVSLSGNGNAVWESGIYLFHLKGLASASQDSVWSNVDVTNSGQFNVSIINAVGTNASPLEKDKLTLSNSGSTFTNSGQSVPGDHISIFNSGTANFQVVVNNATFSSAVGQTSDGIQVDASGSAHTDATITGCTFGGSSWRKAMVRS